MRRDPVLLDLRALTFMDSTGVRVAARGGGDATARSGMLRARRAASRASRSRRPAIGPLLPLVDAPPEGAA